ncbi:MAG: hypothetical protein AB8H03_22950 [Saprospiraceae bacterium]
METISVLENISVFENAGDESTVLAQVNEMDFFARMDETRKNGKTWSKIILADGKMGWIESKKTFQWRPVKVGQRNLFCTSLEKETLNEKILLSIGSTIYIVANDPKVLVRLENHQLGELPETFKVKSAPVGSSKVLTIITGMICVFVLHFYASWNNINISATFSQPRIFMGYHPKYFILGIVITGLVMYSSYYIFNVLGSGIGEVSSLFSKLKKLIFREIKIRK